MRSSLWSLSLPSSRVEVYLTRLECLESGFILVDETVGVNFS